MTRLKIIGCDRLYLWPQWLATFEVFLLELMIGIAMGWTTPFIGKLSSAHSPFVVTKEHISWVASIAAISRPIGAIIGTITTSLFGSKLSIYFCGFYSLCGWICLIGANSIEVVIVSMMFGGLGMGAQFCIYPVYISEIAEPKIRGRLMSFLMQGFLMGILLGNIMGTYLDPWVYAAINLLPNALFLGTFLFFPNTPYYFVRRNKVEEAIYSIEWFNRKIDSQKEFENLSEFLASSPSLSFFESLKQLKTPINRNLLIKINVINSVGQLCGVFAIIEYMEVLFTKAQVSVVEPSSAVTIINVIGVFSGWVAVYISDKFGRITIYFATYLTLCFVIFCWGLNYQLLDLGYNGHNLQWITIFSSIIFRFCLSIGYLPLVPVIMAEVFAPNVKNVSICISSVVCGLFVFIICKNFQFMVDHMTHHYVFYLFSGILLCIGIYAKIYIPETKGKTLQEIQAILNKSKQQNNENVV